MMNPQKKLRFSVRSSVIALAIPWLAAPVFTERASAQPTVEASDEASKLTAEGRALIYAGKLKQAEDVLRRAAKLRGQSIESLYELARVKFASGDLKQAKTACKALTEKDEHAVLSAVCQARAFLLWRRASRAEEFLDRARTMDGSHPEVLLAFADMKRLAGEVAASKDAYLQVLGMLPGNADAHFGLGELYLVTPDFEAAKRAFRDALVQVPVWPNAAYQLGKLQHGAEAVATLEKALAARPDWLEARIALGEAKLEAGDLDGSEALFRAVLKTQPKHALSHARLGMVLEAKRDFAGAEQELQAGLAALPNDLDAALAMARVFAQTDRVEDAFTLYRTASGLDRQSPRALIDAGVLALTLSRNSLAQAFLEKAVERAPGSAQAQARFADALLARGDKAAAKEHYKLALAGSGDIDRKDVERRLAALK